MSIIFLVSCIDKYDKKYEEDCRNGNFEERFRFDHDRKQCDPFWYGGCKSESENIFLDLDKCESLCERPHRDLSRKAEKM